MFFILFAAHRSYRRFALPFEEAKCHFCRVAAATTKSPRAAAGSIRRAVEALCGRLDGDTGWLQSLIGRSPWSFFAAFPAT